MRNTMRRLRKEGSAPSEPSSSDAAVVETAPPLDVSEKTWTQRMLPVFACGAGLFSDGYLNGVIGSVNTMLSIIYKKEYTASAARRNVSSITFAGTVVGILIFGWTSDHWSRKWSLVISTMIVLLFAILATGSYGAGGSTFGLFEALTAWRFLLGIGIGGEYPAGSVGCAEATGELKSGTRNRWFIFWTNFTIDMGFVIAAAVPAIVVAATGENHLRVAWRICLGIGIIPPLSLIWMRYNLGESEAFKRENMAHARTPWKLVFKLYWFRILVVSTIWFLYDFSSYAFGLYSSTILDNLYGSTAPLTTIFAWNILLNFFYIPGAFIGAFASDRFGPRLTLAWGVLAQAVVGFIMAAVLGPLSRKENVGAFVVVYGIFLSLGELGPGDNIGLVASKTCATPVRGQYYAIGAAMGKIGAFVGVQLFPILQADAGSDVVKQNQYPFWVASSLCVFSSALAFWCLPEIGQDTIMHEDARFRAYIKEKGYDTSGMGSGEYQGLVEREEDRVVVGGKSEGVY